MEDTLDIISKGIIILLKSAILQTPGILPDGFHIGQAMPVIREHNLVPLCYEGAVSCGISPMDPAMRELFQSYCKILQISERQIRELQSLYAAFEEHGIDYLPLKGSRMKYLYPKPELRTMGDADILIRTEQYERLVPVLERLGFTAGQETDHELVWRSKGLYLELHKRLIPSYNRDLYPYFGDGWNRAVKEKGCRYGMKAEDEFIYLFTHFAKHFRDGGIGCRHVADLWVFLRAKADLDETYIQKELEKLQLLGFYQNVRTLMPVWFEDGLCDEKTELMTEFIFASGSFGRIESRVLSITVRDTGHYPLGFNGRLMYLWRTAFPGVDVLKEKYTVLKRMPWMLPLVWLVRPFYKILFETKDLHRQKKNIMTLSRENLDQKDRMLKYFDLEYRF